MASTALDEEEEEEEEEKAAVEKDEVTSHFSEEWLAWHQQSEKRKMRGYRAGRD